MSEVQLPNGLRVYGRKDNAPQWVGDSIVINKAEFIAWLNQQPDDTVRLQIATSQKGGKYAKVDTWKPTPRGEETPF